MARNISSSARKLLQNTRLRKQNGTDSLERSKFIRCAKLPANFYRQQFQVRLPISLRRMLGTTSKDFLNYQLIMEGFYYDAEIEHITEIVKNSLYFAVLEGEHHKVITNTHDTYYFSIDDELVYTNYYLDFGPLNISCLYKYCCKLKNYLQYAQGARVVHYTTSNPAKLANAALLLGCYTIIYLTMDPNDIYQVLSTTVGPFKPYVDASQGANQYTIRLLDCFQAVKKALGFNFFNFNDFDVKQYDLHDKLQNGDMNWLLPRKFLAFIGPTDNEIMNGHSPTFYIKYFLDNDVKTVIRLNNKVYDPSVFTDVGIEHYDLFFPDGTVPSKHILLRFLELSENARAAVAVHCKAGLGRTGSLIGAYIIKHYHVTAREAIAWMRICRPGSVIGQQQGWLEKIENWLWRQGSQYRVHHFGDGDKIPHHKFGIYSKEWPKEREKVIRQVQRRRLETQRSWLKAKSMVENSQIDRGLLQTENAVRGSVAPKKPSVKAQKPAPAVQKDDETKKISKLLNKMEKSSQVLSRFAKPMQENKNEANKMYDVNYQDLAGKLKPKRLNSFFKYKEINDAQKIQIPSIKGAIATSPDEFYDSASRVRLGFTDDHHEGRRVRVKSKRRNHSENREQLGDSRIAARIRRQLMADLEQTQGDKLNQIKAQRFASSSENESAPQRARHPKPRRRLVNMVNAETFNRSKPSTSKKIEPCVNPVSFIKRSHFQSRL